MRPTLHDPALMSTRGQPGPLAVMTLAQLSRGIALRRYGYGRSVQQIADEAGLEYRHVLSVLKGEPVSIAVAARLTGYLRTPSRTQSNWHDHYRASGETRRTMLRRLVTLRKLARKIGLERLGKSRRQITGWTDDELRAYCYNVEDVVKNKIFSFYPVLADRYKFWDGMEVWEVLERIDQLKSKAEVRAAIADHYRVPQTVAARGGGKAA